MNKVFALIALLIASCAVTAQFAPAAGVSGSTAFYKDSSAFVAWATGCQLQLGWQDIADTTLGHTAVGDNTSAIGNANGSIVSLGDGGVATLTFTKPIINGQGFDFAVFENGFSTGGGKAFLELAFVEVSSDGVNFVRFPATSHIPDSVQLAMEGVDCALINNLAGKYVSGYGTPFDLEELIGEPNLDVNNISYVRIIDVVGSVNDMYATYDSEGNKVNDPYPTPFPSSGFDLDAVGVINQKYETGLNNAEALAVSIYPNPAKDVVYISTQGRTEVQIVDLNGKLLQSSIFNLQSSINISDLSAGIYIIHSTAGSKTQTTKLVVQ